MKSQRQSNFERHVVKPLAVVTVGALATFGLMHEREANIKSEYIPGIAQIAGEPHEQYTAQPGDNPTTIAERFGQGPDSKLVSEITEQEHNGVIEQGQSIIIPEGQISTVQRSANQK